MPDGEGPREKEEAECGEAEPAWHDGEAAQQGLQGTNGGRSLGLRAWGVWRWSPSGVPQRGLSSQKPWGQKRS